TKPRKVRDSSLSLKPVLSCAYAGLRGCAGFLPLPPIGLLLLTHPPACIYMSLPCRTPLLRYKDLSNIPENPANPATVQVKQQVTRSTNPRKEPRSPPKNPAKAQDRGDHHF